MSRIAYVDGRYIPKQQAAVGIEDRGLQFADGVYEVVCVYRNTLIDAKAHIARLHHSLDALRIPPPMADGPLHQVMREVARKNRVRNGMIYIQVTRGVAPRDHPFPADPRPTLIVTAKRGGPPTQKAATGVAVKTVPDIRWGRCDVKSTALLPNVLSKQKARDAGAFEAWQVDGDGFVTEGTSTNAWIITADGALVTRHADSAILSGVTRDTVESVAGEAGLRLEERPFSVAEAQAAAEAFTTSTTLFVLPVVRIDDAIIGAGVPGPATRRLQALYQAHLEKQAGEGRP